MDTSIHICVRELLIKLILQTWEQEGHLEPECVSFLNTISLCDLLNGHLYFHNVPCSL